VQTLELGLAPCYFRGAGSGDSLISNYFKEIKNLYGDASLLAVVLTRGLLEVDQASVIVLY
jgi:hypothetical protein